MSLSLSPDFQPLKEALGDLLRDMADTIAPPVPRLTLDIPVRPVDPSLVEPIPLAEFLDLLEEKSWIESRLLAISLYRADQILPQRLNDFATKMRPRLLARYDAMLSGTSPDWFAEKDFLNSMLPESKPLTTWTRKHDPTQNT